MINTAILLAGGKGTRIGPSTLAISKHLIPIYDKPMIFYPLGVLVSLGVTKIIIVVNPDDKEKYKKLLGNGDFLNIKILYVEQKSPNGLPEAFKICENKIKGKNVIMILGDQLLYTKKNYLKNLRNIINNFKDGAQIFSYHVKNINKFGAIKKVNGKFILKEKPKSKFSNDAVIGLYAFDKDVVKYTKKLKKSSRGEYEIVDLIKKYSDIGKLRVQNLHKKKYLWQDLGSPSSLLKINKLIEKNYKLKSDTNGYIEFLAYDLGFIKKTQVINRLNIYKKNQYVKKINKLINN